MKKLIFTIFVGLMLASGSAGAQLWDGHDFKKTCTQESDEYVATICSSFVIGVAQAGISNRIICTPENVTNGQALAVVTKYMNDHPENLHVGASDLVVASLMEAFPCPQK